MNATTGHRAGKVVNLAFGPREYEKRLGQGKGPQIAATLESLGCTANLLGDGDPDICACHLLILYGNCRTLQRSAKLLKRRVNNRPRVAMWQIDPLPPSDLDRRLEQQALRLAQLFAGRRLLRPVEMLVGLPLYRQIVQSGLGPFSNSSSDHYVDIGMARTTVETYAAIRRGLAEGWLDRAYVSTTGRQRFLAERGIEAGFAPIGDHPDLGEDRQLERDIDVLFIGSLGKWQRQQRLMTIVDRLRHSGVRVEIVSEGLYGDRRTNMLNRTKIVLHVHKYPWDTPWMRWTMVAANGSLVVSEPLVDPAPFEPGVHYFEAPMAEIPETVMRLLADPERIHSAANCCREFVRTQFTLRGSVETILADLLPPVQDAA